MSDGPANPRSPLHHHDHNRSPVLPPAGKCEWRAARSLGPRAMDLRQACCSLWDSRTLLPPAV